MDTKTDERERELEEEIENAETAIERIEAEIRLSVLLQTKEHPRRLELVQSIEKLSMAEGYDRGLAYARFHQAEEHFKRRNDLQTGLRLYNEARHFFAAAHDQKGQAQVLAAIAQAYIQWSDWAQALEYLLEALMHSEAAGDIRGQALSLFRIGMVYSDSDDSRKAIESYLRAIALYTALENTYMVGVIYNSCCVDYRILGEYAQAQDAGEKAFQAFEQTDDVFGSGVALSTLGEVTLARRDFLRAIQQFEQALALFEEGRLGVSTSEVLETQLNLSQAYKALSNTNRALFYANAALSQANEQEIKGISALAHDQLAQICESQGNLAAALHHTKQYIAIKESYLNEESQREIHNLQIVHQTNEALAESERQRALREQDRHYFQRLAQIKEEFVHNATHDIKNPVRVINQATSLLQEKLPAEDATTRQQLNTITHQSQRIMHLVEDVLELARLESVPAIHTEPVAVMTWLAEFVDGFEPLAAAKAIDLSMEVHPLDLTCELNKYRLEQAIGNLVSNALQYTRHGGRVQLYAAKNDDQVQIQIIDNGVGIPADSIEHVFERFYRVDNPIVDEMDGNEIADELIEGTGLGLSVAKLGVEQHGGTIEVDSAVGQGTTFTIMLPL